MLQEGTTTETPVNETVIDNTTVVDPTTNSTTVDPNGDNNSTVDPNDNSTNIDPNANVTTNSTTNTTNTTTVEAPEPDFNYTCFNCMYNKLSWDRIGCFNHTKNKTRVNSRTVKTYAGCVAAGQNITNNSYAIELGDLRNVTANNETFNVSYKCS